MGRPVQSRESNTSLLSEEDRHSGDMLERSYETTEVLSAASISEPIPLPYYPLQYSTDNSNSIIVPYSSSLVSTTTNPCSPDIRSFFCPTPHTALFAGLSFHDNAQDSAHSDTELFGPSSRLQNRIARKINRLKNRRLGVYRPRRAQSTSDLTSMTSQSESDADLL